MSTLRDVVPRDFFYEFMNTRAAKLLDCEVVADCGYMDGQIPLAWPGKERNVLNWWKLADGRCVGWNENPSRGWSFPVYGKKTKK